MIGVGGMLPIVQDFIVKLLDILRFLLFDPVGLIFCFGLVLWIFIALATGYAIKGLVSLPAHVRGARMGREMAETAVLELKNLSDEFGVEAPKLTFVFGTSKAPIARYSPSKRMVTVEITFDFARIWKADRNRAKQLLRNFVAHEFTHYMQHKRGVRGFMERVEFDHPTEVEARQFAYQRTGCYSADVFLEGLRDLRSRKGGRVNWDVVILVKAADKHAEKLLKRGKKLRWIVAEQRKVEQRREHKPEYMLWGRVRTPEEYTRIVMRAPKKVLPMLERDLKVAEEYGDLERTRALEEAKEMVEERLKAGELTETWKRAEGTSQPEAIERRAKAEVEGEPAPKTPKRPEYRLWGKIRDPDEEARRSPEETLRLMEEDLKTAEEFGEQEVAEALREDIKALQAKLKAEEVEERHVPSIGIPAPFQNFTADDGGVAREVANKKGLVALYCGNARWDPAGRKHEFFAITEDLAERLLCGAPITADERRALSYWIQSGKIAVSSERGGGIVSAKARNTKLIRNIKRQLARINMLRKPDYIR